MGNWELMATAVPDRAVDLASPQRLLPHFQQTC
jgi:hypothetical protein